MKKELLPEPSSRRIGRFEEADGGTLFLDEIGEMELNLQTKLLRVLQEKEIVRIGSNKPVKTDCRIIVATNKNLKEEVKKGKFREDLYYRLLGLPIELPPLRDRGNDILILARHFIGNFCNENNIPLKSLSPQAQKKLMSYTFPGNVRELKSVIELAVTLSVKEEIEPSDFVLDAGDLPTSVTGDDLTMREYELKILKATLRKHNNDISLAAKKLDISVSTIYRMLKEERLIREICSLSPRLSVSILNLFLPQGHTEFSIGRQRLADGGTESHCLFCPAICSVFFLRVLPPCSSSVKLRDLRG